MTELHHFFKRVIDHPQLAIKARRRDTQTAASSQRSVNTLCNAVGVVPSPDTWPFSLCVLVFVCLWVRAWYVRGRFVEWVGGWGSSLNERIATTPLSNSSSP